MRDDEGKTIGSYRAYRRWDLVRGLPFPSPIMPGRGIVCCRASFRSGVLAVNLDRAMNFADAPPPALAGPVLGTVAAASSITLPADVSPLRLVLPLASVGAMDGRAALSEPRSPASCSFSLRFSLRACDFEYGARDASNPVVDPPHHFCFLQGGDDRRRT